MCLLSEKVTAFWSHTATGTAWSVSNRTHHQELSEPASDLHVTLDAADDPCEDALISKTLPRLVHSHWDKKRSRSFIWYPWLDFILSGLLRAQTVWRGRVDLRPEVMARTSVSVNGDGLICTLLYYAVRGNSRYVSIVSLLVTVSWEGSWQTMLPDGTVTEELSVLKTR